MRTDLVVSISCTTAVCNGDAARRAIALVAGAALGGGAIQQLQAWQNSAAQMEVDAIRVKSSDSLSFIVEGLTK
jgi:hypothetical protein